MKVSLAISAIGVLLVLLSAGMFVFGLSNPTLSGPPFMAAVIKIMFFAGIVLIVVGIVGAISAKKAK